MAKDMLGVAVRKLVTLPVAVLGVVCDLLEKLADPEWIEASKKFLRKENPWAVKITSNLLKAIATVDLPPIESFSAKDQFREGEVGDVKIGWIGDNFRKAFLAGDGMIEGAVAEATLCMHQLRKASVDGPIIAELGGEGIAETSLAQMYEMMKAQGHGEKGNLLVDGYANIFYVRDASGTFWAVVCRWDSSSGDWHVGASPVACPVGWDAGDQVLSR